MAEIGDWTIFQWAVVTLLGFILWAITVAVIRLGVIQKHAGSVDHLLSVVMDHTVKMGYLEQIANSLISARGTRGFAKGIGEHIEDNSKVLKELKEKLNEDIHKVDGRLKEAMESLDMIADKSYDINTGVEQICIELSLMQTGYDNEQTTPTTDR